MTMVDDYQAAKTLARDSQETLRTITPRAVYAAYEGLKEAGLIRLERLADPGARQAFADAVKAGVLAGVSDFYQQEPIDDVRARHAMWGAVGYVPEQLTRVVEGLKDKFSYDIFMKSIAEGTRYAEATALDQGMPLNALSLDRAGEVVGYAASKGLSVDLSKLDSLESLVKAIELADQAQGLTATVDE